MEHLQETGIGRTVNALRKDEGEIGVAAKALVAKWKTMVASEEPTNEEEDTKANEGNNTEIFTTNVFLYMCLLYIR